MNIKNNMFVQPLSENTSHDAVFMNEGGGGCPF
ncbi:hypothetical protein MmiHf6_11580 [Methanimicrococcus hongohii]|uniref:Uncharacterized protein n=1 Tax=Methanimicrococcus hongohii TaxID=3028295 RepID=A0AA96V9E1_9EURY|nr:hypothetical protein MmiHf6_11580 [Methanimicrococcus sp. Hf6]